MNRIFILCVVLLVAISCNNTPTAQQTTDAKVKKQTVSTFDSATTHNLLFVVNRYYELKDALVATNDSNTYRAASSLSASADSFKMMMIKDSAKAIALLPLLDTIIHHSKAIASINDKTCELQRIEFSPVSDAIYQLVKKAEVKDAGIYQQYCPMAFNDKGAYWLSNVEEIKNPYFGKKMLECGEVKDSL